MNRIILSLLLIANSTFAADRYWVGGTGSWTDKGMWASASDGLGGIGVPTANDNAIFDDKSFGSSNDTVYLIGSSIAHNVDFSQMTNYTPTVFLDLNFSLEVHGSLELVSNLKTSFLGRVLFKSTNSGNTIKTAGHVFNKEVDFNGVGGYWTLKDKLNIGASGYFVLTNGYLTTNDFEINSPSVGNGYRAGPSGLFLGSSVLNLKEWNFYETDSLTLDADSAEINLQDPGAILTFNGGGLSYNIVRMNGSSVTIYNPDYFKYLFLEQGTDLSIYPYMIGGGITVDNLIAHGSITDSVDVFSSSPPTQATIYDNNGGFTCLRYAKIRDINFSGGTNNAEFSRDLGNVTGVTFAPCGAFDITINGQNELCYQQCNAEAWVSINGGVGPFDIQWDDPEGRKSSSISSLCPGKYKVTVTDLYSSSVLLDSITLNASVMQKANISKNNITCNGLANGTAVSVPSGFKPPILYDWNNGFSYNDFITNLDTGKYVLKIADANDCILLDSIIIIEPDTLVASTSGQAVKCKGGASGTATAVFMGGNGGNTYLWAPGGQTTQTATGLTAGTYTVTVTDSKSCSDTGKVIITQPATKLTTSLSTLNATCPSACNGTGAATASGGVPPYNYYWHNNGSITSLTNTLCGGLDTLSILDNGGCQFDTVVTIGADGANPVIFIDSVNHSLGSLTKAWVYLLSWRSGSKMPKTDSLRLDVPTPHLFTDVPIGSYVIYVKPDQGTAAKLLPCFYGKTHKWEKATVINVACDDTTHIIIEMLELPAATSSGPARIAGRVTTSGTGKLSAAGDPVPGIDVAIEQIPGGSIQQMAITDSDGEYEFKDIPSGKTYAIHVDVPGLPLDTTYEITVNDNDSIFLDKDFCVDTSWIDLCGDTALSIAKINKMEFNSMEVYPNPYKGEITISVELEKGEMSLEVYNLLGKRIMLLDQGNKAKGEYVYKFSARQNNLAAGTYILKLTQPNHITTKRIIELQ